MENKDTGFYEKIDKSMAEILKPKQKKVAGDAFDFQIDFKGSYDKFVSMTKEDRKQYMQEKYTALMEFIKVNHGNFKKQEGNKYSGLKVAHICGEMGSEIIILFLATKGWAYVSKGNDKEYDFILSKNGEQKLFELKTDTKHMLGGYNKELDVFERESWNVFFETAGRDGMSGIRVTKSPIFITYFPIIDEMYISDTETVKKNLKKSLDDYDNKKIIQPSGKPITEIKPGIKFHWAAGDSNSGTRGFLVDRVKLREEFFTYIAKPIDGKTLFPIKAKAVPTVDAIKN